MFRKGKSGWCYGKNQRSGGEGLFPGIIAVRLQPTEDIIRSIYTEVGVLPPETVATAGCIAEDSTPGGIPQPLYGEAHDSAMGGDGGSGRRRGAVDPRDASSDHAAAATAGNSVNAESGPLDPTALYTVPKNWRKKLQRNQSSSASIALRVPAAVMYSSIVGGSKKNGDRTEAPRPTEDIYAVVPSVNARGAGGEKAPPLPSRQYQTEEMHPPSILVELSVDEQGAGALKPGALVKTMSTTDLVCMTV